MEYKRWEIGNRALGIEDDIAFIKTTYDISLDFGKSLLPRGFSPA